MFVPSSYQGNAMSDSAGRIIICRCEEVSREEVLDAIRSGCETLDEIKRATRAGMGRCQGEGCAHMIAGILSEVLGVREDGIQPFTARFPVGPVSLGELAATGDELAPGQQARSSQEAA